VCIDASLAIKLVVWESFSDLALALWQNWIKNSVECIAPPILPFEVSSVIWNKYIRKQLTAEEAEKSFNLPSRKWRNI
jgi:predicted nucleic acid-binding protein